MGWVCGWVFLQAVSLAGSSVAPRFTPVNAEVRATLRSDYQIDVVVFPHRGDAWTRLAKRITGDAERWREIARSNSAGDNLTVEQRIHVPFPMLRAELQRQVIATLFPADARQSDGWRHVVVGTNGIEAESLWNIAEWFTGNGANYLEIRRSNPSQALSTRKGDQIFIPANLLTEPFRRMPATLVKTTESGVPGPVDGVNLKPEGTPNAPQTATEIRRSENGPPQHAPANVDVPDAAALAVAPGLRVPTLTFGRSAAGPYALYRLQKGEALYSSVAIRFTGRVYSRDVGDVLARIVRFNEIDDVARIPIGYPVRIPMELLLPQYLPAGDPTRVAQETAQRESVKLAHRTRARNLAGVRVILDAGHGGRDVGTVHDGVDEASYVYDVMCRLKRILEAQSGAAVFPTTRSRADGYDVADRDELEAHDDHAVLTTPRYTLDDPVVGVNLRWYLANSIFRKAIRAGVEEEKVVFVSLHADSLHPSLRGAMLYIPGEKYVQGSYEKREKVYRTRLEVQESPRVRHSPRESLAAEGLSRGLAGSIVDAFDEAGLHVHPFNPVRDNVVRDDREWVPAVIRYNVVPTRVLIELCNLGNDRDRSLMKTRRYRQQVAEAIYKGLVSFYSDDEEVAVPAAVADGKLKIEN